MDDPARGSSLWAYATGVGELIAAAIAPVLGAIADAGLPRKPWIAAFSVLLVAGCCGLFLAAPGRIDLLPLVLVSFAVATIGAELATVFTNAMMPSLVGDHKLGTLSGLGWATGYVGGLVSLVLVLGSSLPIRIAARRCSDSHLSFRSIPRRAKATAWSDRSRPLGISCSCCRSSCSRPTGRASRSKRAR